MWILFHCNFTFQCRYLIFDLFFKVLKDHGFQWDHFEIGRLQSRYYHRYLHFNCILHYCNGIQLLDVHIHWKELSKNSHIPNPTNWLFDNMPFAIWNDINDVGQCGQIWQQAALHNCHRFNCNGILTTNCELPLCSYHIVSDHVWNSTKQPFLMRFSLQVSEKMDFSEKSTQSNW